MAGHLAACVLVARRPPTFRPTHYRGLTPDDLIDISVVNGLHFHAATGEGVAFHLIGALSEFGKLGVVCIGQTHERAMALHSRTIQVLDAEAIRMHGAYMRWS